MSKELVRVERTPSEEWRAIIMDPSVMPQTLGTDVGTLFNKAYAAWETMDNPPTSTVTAALFELAATKEIEINGHIISRGPEAQEIPAAQ